MSQVIARENVLTSKSMYTVLCKEVYMRKVELTVNEQKKYEVIKKLVETDGNKNRAAMTLGVTRRTIDRLILIYRSEGKEGFSHKNKGRTPSNALSKETINEIVTLYENKYYDANFRHFGELLERNHGIKVSDSTIRKIMFDANILSPKAHRQTKRNLKNKLITQLNQTRSKKKQAVIKESIVQIDEHHPRRPRCSYTGEMLQMDASLHTWFGGFKSTLHAAIDDASGAIVGAYFEKQETLSGYYHVFEQILTDYGIPYMFYTDRRTVFEYKRTGECKVENNTLTQFAYACKQLGVDIKTTSVAQAKGRIERLFQTLQSRLCIELRLAGVTTIEQANEFLKSYLKEFNSQFALPLDSMPSVFETQPEKNQIDLILSVICERSIDNGHCIRIFNKHFIPVDENGTEVYFHSKTKALVIKTMNDKLYCSINDRIYCMDEIPEHETKSRYFKHQKPEEKKHPKKKRTIPPMDHPWRKDNFMKFVKAMEGHEEDWAA